VAGATSRFAFLLAFAALTFASPNASAGEAEWQAHMKAGMAAYQRGDYRSAAASFAAALKEAEAFGESHQRFATTINNLAVMYMHQGRYAEAEPLYRRTLSIYEKALGPDHPDLGTTLNNLAGCIERKAATRKPSRFTGGLYRFARKRSVQSIRMLAGR
jgi:tetratricopeptide (TPR) repeat protein